MDLVCTTASQDQVEELMKSISTVKTVLYFDHCSVGDPYTNRKLANTESARLHHLGTWSKGPTAWRAYWCGDSRVLIEWKGSKAERAVVTYVQEIAPQISTRASEYLEYLGKALHILTDMPGDLRIEDLR
jgi:hypothetical protein